MTMVIERQSRKSGNRKVPRQELRQRIAAAAIALFHERGYDLVTVDEIVTRAAVSKGTFFNFFPSKSDVLLVYFHEIDSQIALWRGKLDPCLPQVALERFFAKAEKLLRKEGSLIETLARRTWADSSLLQADSTSALRDRLSFSEFFRQARDQGTVNSTVDPETAGDILGDLWTGSILLWLSLGRRGKLSATVRAKLQVLFNGLNNKRRAR